MKDLKGQRFGRLVALRPTEKRRNGSVVWVCKCDCGSTVLSPSAYLCSGQKQSCGCLQKERYAESIAKNSVTTVKSLKGQRFGRLTVIGPSEKRKHQAVLWECKCDCGNTTFLVAYSLVSGMTKSCGCLKKDYLQSYGKGRRIDLSGKRYGRLTVIQPTEKRQGSSIVWECVCTCGKTAYVSANSLRSGDTQSCGCLRNERVREANARKQKQK